MTAIITQGDAASLPLPDASVDLIVTSPPYYSLRSYTDGGRPLPGQIGAEPTPGDYLESLWRCTREWMRVLKPGGSIFVNLGDKYAEDAAPGRPDAVVVDTRRGTAVGGKSLLGLPWRYALGCTDRLGLTLRAEIVWAKPNGLPESVTDRVRRSHEQVFHFVKQPRYYSAVDEVREPHASPFDPKAKPGPSGNREIGRGQLDAGIGNFRQSPLGKLPGSVWTIPTSRLTVPGHLGVDHFAPYPPVLVRRIVLGWSPREVCTACGEGRRPVSDKDRQPLQRVHNGRGFSSPDHGPGTTKGLSRDPLPHRTTVTITGYACACPATTAPATPGVVLDPFGGTGTTALVASCYGRTGISVDLSLDYCRLAGWRVTDPKQRARAAS